MSDETSSSRAADVAREHAWALTVWVAMVCWTGVLYLIVRDAYLDFRLGRFDLGNMAQSVWSTTEGRPLEITHAATGEQVLRLGAHVDPFLVLLSPVWMAWPSPLALALVQIAVTSLGALPVFWLGRRHLRSERSAGLFALAYLAYPWLATSAVGAIHPVTFAIPLFVASVWFLDTDRMGRFAVCAALAMSTGELMGLPVIGLGIWFAIARQRRRAGAAIALAGAAWTFFAVYVVVPHYAGEASTFYGFYDHVGGSPQGVVRTLLSDPTTVLGALFEMHDIVYVLWLALPLLGLFLLSPGIAAVGLPQLLANTLSDFRSMSDPRYHSVAAIVPFLVVGALWGVARLRAQRRGLAIAGVLVCSSIVALAVGPWTRALGGLPLGGRADLPESKIEALRDAVSSVPRGVPVTASNRVGAHLASRRYLYPVPIVGNARWAVIDLDDPWVTRPDSPILTQDPAKVRSFARMLEQAPGWERTYARERVLVLRRVSS